MSDGEEQTAETNAVHHHADGLFCDDCPDAMKLLIEKHLREHKWLMAWEQPVDRRDCSCGWHMSFRGRPHSHVAHQTDVIAAALETAGFTREVLRPADAVRPACNCGEVWAGHPNPHAITCPLHVTSRPGESA